MGTEHGPNAEGLTPRRSWGYNGAISLGRYIDMTATNLNISIDSELEAQAKDVLASLGLDITEAINIFLQQTIRQHSIPFAIPDESEKKMLQFGCMKDEIWMADDFDTPMESHKSVKPEKRGFQIGCMKGKIWMADDFDAPMEEFEEYM